MTAYEQGFIQKCAEYGIGGTQSIQLLKQAMGRMSTSRPASATTRLSSAAQGDKFEPIELPLSDTPPVYRFPAGEEPWNHHDSLNSTNNLVIRDVDLSRHTPDLRGLGDLVLPGGRASITSSVPRTVTVLPKMLQGRDVRGLSREVRGLPLWSFAPDNTATPTSLGEEVLERLNSASDAAASEQR